MGHADFLRVAHKPPIVSHPWQLLRNAELKLAVTDSASKQGSWVTALHTKVCKALESHGRF